MGEGLPGGVPNSPHQELGWGKHRKVNPLSPAQGHLQAWDISKGQSWGRTPDRLLQGQGPAGTEFMLLRVGAGVGLEAVRGSLIWGG